MSFFYKYMYYVIYIYLFKLRSALNSCKFSINAPFQFKCCAYSREHLLNINSQAFKITTSMGQTKTNHGWLDHGAVFSKCVIIIACENIILSFSKNLS